jgi:hypothetical protein
MDRSSTRVDASSDTVKENGFGFVPMIRMAAFGMVEIIELVF